jgi:hypothetical protein
LFDVQPEKLDEARHCLEGAGCQDVGFHGGDASGGPPFPGGGFDVAFLAAVVPVKVTRIHTPARVLGRAGCWCWSRRFLAPIA